MLLISKFKISGHSMEPSIKSGSTVFISRIPYLIGNPQKKDVIVFKHKRKHFLKRISKIKQNQYFVKGDNKKDSLDSNKFGPITKDKIIGKVIFNI